MSSADRLIGILGLFAETTGLDAGRGGAGPEDLPRQRLVRAAGQRIESELDG
jgi:hypothetical protein